MGKLLLGVFTVKFWWNFFSFLFELDFPELRKYDISGTTQSDDGNDKDPTDWKKCAVILLSRLLLTMGKLLLLLMGELFGHRNEVPDGSVSDQGR